MIYRTVQISFWTDRKVEEDFTPEDRYFYLYLFTNPHTNLAGCYELGIKQASYETGYNDETIRRLIERFTEEHKVIKYFPETKEVLLLNWYKYNWTKSKDFLKAINKQINAVKSEDARKYLEGLYTVYTGSIDGVGTVSKELSDPVGTYCPGTSVSVTDTVTVSGSVSVKDSKDDLNPWSLMGVEDVG